MPVPKRKRSKSRRDKRFANKGIKPCSVGSCSNCDQAIQSHSACQNCGFYRGRKVMTTKNERSEKRGQARKEQQEKLASRSNEKEVEEPIEAKAE